MATGARHYGDIRATAQKWLEEVEIPANRIDEPADHLFRRHAAAFADCPQPGDASEAGVYGRPTGGLDVSVQARLLDLLRGLVVELNLAVVIVTHDLGVARLLADRLLVMNRGKWWRVG